MTKIKVLDQGYVKPILIWGDESLIIESARMSTGGEFKGWDRDFRLLSYLYQHRHECYHPSMEVLTKDGWKRWDQCEGWETYIVPDPKTHELTEECLETKSFPFNGDMYTFRNKRMSYSVTPNHRMYFKPKNGVDKGKWTVCKVQDQSNWGNYEPVNKYYADREKPSDIGVLVGMYLGDGFKYSSKLCGFKFKEERKLNLLSNALVNLGIPYKTTVDSKGATTLRFTPTEEFCSYLNIENKVSTKQLYTLDHSSADLRGILVGLQNTDGSIKQDRKAQVTFSSTSSELIKQYEGIAARLGYLTNRSTGSNGIAVVNTYDGSSRTSLECRKGYRGTAHYNGKVYCTTTSTGMLIVRGGPKDAAFICGNTPFEFVGATFEIKLPIFVAREFMRHRVFSFNEASARYIPMPDEKFTMGSDEVWERINSMGDNKQAGAATDYTPSWYEVTNWLSRVDAAYEAAEVAYRYGLARGIPKELARITMPVSQYTTFRVNGSLRNWLGFLVLRDAPNAQKEIRDYAKAISNVLEDHFENTFKLYKKDK